MAYRNINDWMLSGEALGLATKNTIKYTSADPEADGVFLRIDANGLTYGHRVIDQDKHWTGTDTTQKDIPSDGTEVSIVSVSIDDDVTTSDGTWYLGGRIDNTGTRDALCTITLKADGTVVKTKPITITKDTTGFMLTAFDAFAQDAASGTSFEVTISANRALSLRGDITPSILRVTKAQAAPVTAMATADKVLNVTVDANDDYPTKKAITDSIASTNQNGLLTSNVQFMATDGSRFWQVFFDNDQSEFFATKLAKLS